MKNSSINRGELLKKVIQRSRFNITQISKAAGFNRSSYYNHIEKEDLSFSILEKYGDAMDYDFGNDIPDMKGYSQTSEPEPRWDKSKTMEELRAERDDYRDKYLKLLEKYNNLMEERLKGS